MAAKVDIPALIGDNAGSSVCRGASGPLRPKPIAFFIQLTDYHISVAIEVASSSGNEFLARESNCVFKVT